MKKKIAESEQTMAKAKHPRCSCRRPRPKMYRIYMAPKQHVKAVGWICPYCGKTLLDPKAMRKIRSTILS